MGMKGMLGMSRVLWAKCCYPFPLPSIRTSQFRKHGGSCDAVLVVLHEAQHEPDRLLECKQNSVPAVATDRT